MSLLAADLDKHRKSGYPPPMPSNLKIGDVTIPGRVLLAPMTGVSDLPFRRAAARMWCVAPPSAKACH
jgi:hypothetical protein